VCKPVITPIPQGSRIAEIAVLERCFGDLPEAAHITVKAFSRGAFFSFIFCYSNRRSPDIYLPLTLRNIYLKTLDGGLFPLLVGACFHCGKSVVCGDLYL